MSEQPLISVIVPVYNGARYLGETLESIFRQTYRPLDVIVIDDGSTDASASIASNFPEVHYAYQPHAGLSVALNHGVELSHGAFLSFLDADDLWLPNKLELQLTELSSAPNLGMIYGQIIQFSSPESPNGYQEEPAEVGYSKCTLLIRREAFFQAGPFNPALPFGEFVDWYMRAREAGIPEKMLPTVVAKRRMHAENMTVRQRENRIYYLKVLKRALDRREQKSIASAVVSPETKSE